MLDEAFLYILFEKTKILSALTSGALVVKSFKEIPTILNSCIAKYLSNLPDKLKIIIMLGSNSLYVSECKSKIKNLNISKYSEINEVAYIQNGKLFIHVTHPSPANGSIKSWLEGVSIAGHKKKLVLEAINIFDNKI